MTWSEWLAAEYTPGTAAAYAFEAGHYLAWLGGEAEALTADYGRIVTYLAALRKRYDKPATLSRILSAVKAYHRWLLETGRRDDHPALGLTLRDGKRRGGRQVQDLLTEEELRKLLAPRAERYQMLAGRNAVIVGLLVHQALTLRELAELRTGDVDLEAGTVAVSGGRQTVGRRLNLVTSQVMQLHRYVNDERAKLLRKNIPTDRLLLTSRGTAENGEGVQYLVETLRPLVPGKRLTPTVIRQSVIALKLKNGEGLRRVQVFAGHKWVSTTEGYRENNLAELRAAVGRCHPLGNEQKS